MVDNDKERVLREFSQRFCKALAEIGYLPHQQTALGELFGMSGQAVRRWAEGLAMPTPARMPEVANKLGVRRAWLQDGEEPMRPNSIQSTEPTGRAKKSLTEPLMVTSEEIRLITFYRLLTPVLKKSLIEFISLIQKR